MHDYIRLHKLRELQLQVAPQTGRPAHVSAASGLVCIGKQFYVIADDELQLATFTTEGHDPGVLTRILPGELPIKPKQRKRAKPDFESLVLLPAFGPHKHGALLALGSGSTPQRHRAVLLPLKENGSLTGTQAVIDIQPLHDAMQREVGALNVEGAVVCGDRLLLIQRGNKGDGVNAIAAFELSDVHSLLLGATSNVIRASGLTRYDLGEIHDVPLGFSDAAALDDGTLIFAAIAEDTTNSYADGPCAGAAIGVIDAQGQLQRVLRVKPAAKIEGISAERRADAAELLLVTDADDADIPAVLYRASIA